MVLPDGLLSQGFLIQNAESEDLNSYIRVKKDCCKRYVDQYYGGWDNRIQTVISRDSFFRLLEITCFCKILHYGNTVGFFSYKEQQDGISEVSILLLSSASGNGLEEFLINHLISRGKETNKPVYATVYQSSTLKNQLTAAGFHIYDKSRSHYLMSFNKEHEKGTTGYMNRIYGGSDSKMVSERE